MREIEKLLQQADKLSNLLTSRGYDGMFQTNGGYPGTPNESLKKYLYETMLGNERGLIAGISLRTYAQWENEHSNSVECRFSVRLGGTRQFIVDHMSIDHRDQYGRTIKELELHILPGAEIPDKKEAIAKVMAPNQQITRPKGLRI